jgi:hypothetical protein
MPKISAAQRRQELKEYLDSVGILNLSKTALGKKYGVSDVCIGKDLKLIMSDSKPSDASLILKRFDSAFQLALNRALKSLSEASGNKEVNDSIRTLIVVIHEHLASLARLGYPIAEDGTPPPKPNIEAFVAFLESPRYKQLREGRKTTPVAYDNLNWQPSTPSKNERTLPEAQEPILEDEEDDLEEVLDEENMEDNV